MGEIARGSSKTENGQSGEKIRKINTVENNDYRTGEETRILFFLNRKRVYFNFLSGKI